MPYIIRQKGNKIGRNLILSSLTPLHSRAMLSQFCEWSQTFTDFTDTCKSQQMCKDDEKTHIQWLTNKKLILSLTMPLSPSMSSVSLLLKAEGGVYDT